MRTRPTRVLFVHARSVFVAAALLAAASPASGQVTNDKLQLAPGDGATDDAFGWSIAMGDRYVVIGSPQSDATEADSGSAYQYDATTGAVVRELTADDGEAGDRFGSAVAIAGGVIAVGAWRDDDNGTDSGSVYLFDAESGEQRHKLSPSDLDASSGFGGSIAMDGGVLAVGAARGMNNGQQTGTAYLFDSETGSLLHKLTAEDGASRDEFGHSIALDAGLVVVGAVHDADLGFWSGSAFVFDAATGAQLQKLLPIDGDIEDRFGQSVAIEGQTVVVGMEFQGDNGHRAGAAYFFDATTGEQRLKLLPIDGLDNDWFGHSVAIDGGIVAIGARQDDDAGTQSGSAYLFEAESGRLRAKLLPSEASQGDQFGNAIDIRNGVVGVGSIFANSTAVRSGSAYVFGVPDAPCTADINRDGYVGHGDITEFVARFLFGDQTADVNGDGFLKQDDLIAFVEAYFAGC